MRLCKILLLLPAFFFVLPIFPEETKITGSDSEVKELRITAHRLHIPVEQLKNARQALQEATDLSMNSMRDDYSIPRALYSCWRQMNPSRADEIADEFIRTLRSEAVRTTEPLAYQEITGSAVGFMTLITNYDFEKMQPFIRSWPGPSAGTTIPPDFMKNLESRMTEDTLGRLANSDPQKALTLLSGDPKKYKYSYSWQIAQGFMNAGKKEDADRLIDQSIKHFAQNPADRDNIREYKNFLWSASPVLDTAPADAAIKALIANMSKKEYSIGCNGIFKVYGASINLTCIESEVLDILRRLSSRPELVSRTLDSFSSLKRKLAGFGGIDIIYQYGSKSALTITRYGSTETVFQPREPDVPEDSEKLLKELSGQAQSNPEYVKRRLKEAAKKSGIDILVRMAWTNIVGGAELAEMALETARQLNSEESSLQDRADFAIIQAYRQLEGTVDHELFKNGFLLVDQLKKEESKPKPAQSLEIRMGPCLFTKAECLESLLVQDLSKDLFEEAMAHVRSIENRDLKYECLVMIAMALSKPIY
jgi:hypothetical protein